MQRNSLWMAAVVFSAAALLPGCGSSSSPAAPSTPEPALTPADVVRINSAVEAAIGAAFTSAFGVQRVAAMTAGHPRPAVATPISFTGPCGDRGSVSITGSVDSTANGDSLTFNEVITFGSRGSGSNCVSQGVSLEGDPNLSIAARITLDNANTAVLTEQVTNGITFVLPSSATVGRVRYNCSLNYRVTSAGAFTGTSTGSVTTEYPLGKVVSGVSCPQL